MKRRSILYLILAGITSIILLPTGCNKDDNEKCTQQVRVSKNNRTPDSGGIHTRTNPYWMDWPGRDIDLNNLSGMYLAGSCTDDGGVTRYTCSWIGFQRSITITAGNVLHMRSVNCVIKGDIKGNGTLIFESYEPIKNYNSPVGAKLVVDGIVEKTVNLILNDNTTLEESGIIIPTINDLYIEGEIISVDCSITLPYVYRDPKTGTEWLYEAI